jgi:crotonobetainyl-CoA:carnitine CoA-transferase CaiB-like acyl-CoA transferase
MQKKARSPLDGVRVVELGAFIAGPYAASLLAQFGAEVIKVESPQEGDPLRVWRQMHNGTSLWWSCQSRNKKSVTIDLREVEGRRVVRKLLASADIVVENFKPSTLEKWGLGWKDLAALNPRLIMVSISGYGQSGPKQNLPGFAAIAEAMGGLRYVTGYPDRPPVRSGVSLGDTLASLYAVIGALLALHDRNVNGGAGQLVDVALYEAVFAVMEGALPEYSVKGVQRERTGAVMPGISPSNTYRSRDGKDAVIAGNSDGIFKNLMRAIGRPDLGEDPSLARNDGRVQSAERIDAAISQWCSQHSLAEVIELLEAAGVPCGGIYSIADISNDEHFRARDMIQRHYLHDGTPVDMPGIVPKLSVTPGLTKWLGPELGAHTREVLGSIGIQDAEFDALRIRGVV